MPQVPIQPNPPTSNAWTRVSQNPIKGTLNIFNEGAPGTPTTPPRDTEYWVMVGTTIIEKPVDGKTIPPTAPRTLKLRDFDSVQCNNSLVQIRNQGPGVLLCNWAD